MKKFSAVLIAVILAVLSVSGADARDLRSELAVSNVAEPHKGEDGISNVFENDGNCMSILFSIFAKGEDLNASNTLRLEMQESLDGSNYTPVKDYSVICGSPVDASGTVAIFDASAIQTVNYTGRCPYVKFTELASGTISSTTIYIEAIGGDKIYAH